MKHIALIIPFWDVEDQKERSENIAFSEKAWKSFSKYCDDNLIDLKIDVMLYNLGKKPHKEYPHAEHLKHTGFGYRFEKPTRMNNAFIDIHKKGYQYVAMSDPDIIIFEEQYDNLIKTITRSLNPETMITFGFARTKPELREYLNDLNSEHPLILEANPHYEKLPFCGGFFVFDVESFFKLGGFNEDFRVYGFDDVEFSNRWRMQGFKISSNKLPLYHLWHPTVLGTAEDSEKARYTHELKYWRLNLTYYHRWLRLRSPKAKSLGKIPIPPLIYLSPTIYNYTKDFHESHNINTIPFRLDYGTIDLYTLPVFLQKSWGLIPSPEFYATKETESLK